MNMNWSFIDGKKVQTCESFPYAFRAMYHAWRRGIEGKDFNGNPVPKRLVSEMANSFAIRGPIGHQSEKTLFYYSACENARMRNLLTADGDLNGREFKTKRQ